MFMKCKRNSDGWAIYHAALQTMRQQEIKAVRVGQPVQSVAAAFRVEVRRVFRWLADFARSLSDLNNRCALQGGQTIQNQMHISLIAL